MYLTCDLINFLFLNIMENSSNMTPDTPQTIPDQFQLFFGFSENIFLYPGSLAPYFESFRYLEWIRDANIARNPVGDAQHYWNCGCLWGFVYLFYMWLMCFFYSFPFAFIMEDLSLHCINIETCRKMTGHSIIVFEHTSQIRPRLIGHEFFVLFQSPVVGFRVGCFVVFSASL